MEEEGHCLCCWVIAGVKADVPECLGSAALQALTGTSHVLILQSCPKGQNRGSRMGIAVSDTPIRHNDALGSQPLLLRERRGGKKQTPGVCIKTSKCAEAAVLSKVGAFGTEMSLHSPS